MRLELAFPRGVTGLPHEVIAEGNFGTVVYKARAQDDSSTELAVKVIQLHVLSPKLREAARQEVEILKLVSHPVIFKTHSFAVQPDRVLIAGEYIPGGDLFDRLQAKGQFPEREVKRLMRSLLDCVRYLHADMDIVHRDIKLENLLLRDAEDLSSVVLIDFGLARKLKPGGLRTDCGTRNYASPEMLLGRTYGKGVDVWSLGVSLFTLLSGYHPFDSPSPSVLFSNICNGNIQYAVDAQAAKTWGQQTTPLVRELIESMLAVDVSRRSTAPALCSHEWVTD